MKKKSFNTFLLLNAHVVVSTTGFQHFMPYLGFLFLVMLLIDRENRDSEGCREKYGKDWDKYCQIVKYKIIPFIY